MKGSVKDDLYIMDPIPSKMCLTANVYSKGNLWHQHLGHLNHKSIQAMKNQELVEGLPKISPTIGLYKRCILGKMNRKNFKKDKATRATQPLQLVHLDLMDPFQGELLMF